MPALFEEQFLGKYAVVEYGNRLLNASSFSVNINAPTIDITNISVYEPLQVRLPNRRNDPTGNLIPLDPQNKAVYYANAGAPAQTIFGGKRTYKLNVSGFVYLGFGTTYLPTIGDFVKIVITDDAPNPEQTIFELYCIVTDFTYSNDVRGYATWSMSADGTILNQNQESDVAPF